jgi:hypothetical protein
MISKEEARQIVVNQLEFHQSTDWSLKDDQLVIIDEYTIEKDFGWIFFYQSKKFLETDNFSYYLVGNGGYIVNRFDGSFEVTGTAYDIDYYINEYVKKLRL